MALAEVLGPAPGPGPEASSDEAARTAAATKLQSLQRQKEAKKKVRNRTMLMNLFPKKARRTPKAMRTAPHRMPLQTI